MPIHKPMSSIERVAVALRGGRPDRVPIAAIYDYGYVMSSIGRDAREFITCTGEERVRFLDENFRRHPGIDAFFVHAGTNDEWRNRHTIEKLDKYWLVTDRRTGERLRLLPDGCYAQADGTPMRRDPSVGGISRIQSAEDIDRFVPVMTDVDLAASGRFSTVRHFTTSYPDVHFSFQTGSPMVSALGACGGFEEGLTLLASDPELFRRLLERCADAQIEHMAPGREAGAHSTWFTSYYTGADTISPKIYADIVFPAEYRVCRAAKEEGLYVLNWFLGDLMPNLDCVMRLPIDALVLEQGRKTYEIDPVRIRHRVGPAFCLFGFGLENDYCTFNRDRLTGEIGRQIQGAGRDGAFVAGTPIMPPNANPAAVDFYFSEIRRLGAYGRPT
jgi:hypothetical protein